MVLADLGLKLTNALKKLNSATIIDEKMLNEILDEIVMALLQSDVNIKHVAKLRDNVKLQVKLEKGGVGTNLRKIIQKSVVSELTNMLDPDIDPYKPKKGQQNVIMFVGLQGSGKTTTCTKLAYFYQTKGWRTALVCADTFRAGAFAQLRQNATKIKVPFYGDVEEKDPVKLATDGVEHFLESNYEIIIVDTSGRHKQEVGLFEEMIQVADTIKPDDIIFVMDSSIGQACFDQATAFRKAVDVGSVIVTKLDGHAKGGGALSAVAATNSPIIFFGTGEHFDDLESFNAKSFIRRLLGLGDLTHLFETVREAIPLGKQKEMIQDISEGKFTLKHMKEQYQSLLKMGPLDQVVSSLPGMGANMITKGREKESVARIKRFLCMMDSMTAQELNGIKPISSNPSRIQRIARGSGNSIGEVNEMLGEYKKMEKMVTKMKKANFGKGGQDIPGMMRNPGQVMGKLKNVVDPRMLKQIGGPQNLMNIVKEMGNMENMDEMMGMMGGAGGGGGGAKGGRRKGHH